MSWDPWELADSSDADEAKESVKHDLRLLSRYERTGAALVEKFRKIGEALETKKISIYADRIEIRLEVVSEMAALLREASVPIDEFYDELEDLCEAIADGEEHGPVADEIKALPAYARLLAHGERLLKYEFRVGEEDDDQYINWTLEDYLGESAVIYQRLQKVQPPTLMEDDYAGTRAIYGVLTYYDAEYIQMRADELRDERGED